MIRRFAIAGAAVLVAVAGCAPLAQPAPSQEESTEPQSITTAPVEIPDGLVATGSLVAATGEELGEVRIIKDGYVVHFEVPEFVTFTGEPRMTMALSDSPFDLTECGDDNIWQVGIGDEGTMEQGLPGNLFPSSDWSFFTSVVVVGFLDPGAAECLQPILASAPLTWDQPTVRPWVDPVDGGATAGAMGEVDGTLYTTAAGDVWDEIAARFGIGRDDLEWLNPIRTPNGNHTAFAGQVLNLDPDDRSDSESRRPQ